MYVNWQQQSEEEGGRRSLATKRWAERGNKMRILNHHVRRRISIADVWRIARCPLVGRPS
jgi:hypothetical protein